MNKKRLFLLVLVTGLLLTCKNHYVTELLKAPSELIAINVKAYSGSTLLEGGVAFEPGYSPVLRDYAVYIPDETTHFVIEPKFDGKGTVLCLNYDRDEGTSPGDLRFRILPEENELELILTVQRENLGPGEYRLIVMRAENVPVPKGIVLSVNPSIGSFFLDRGVVPELSVTADEPAGGGILSYQWYRNYDNNNRSGTRIEGATGASYRLSEAETSREETVYYYAVITNNINGKTGSMESMTRSITFINKENALNIKSRDVVPIKGGTVIEGVPFTSWDSATGEDYWYPWETPGFEIGKYPVTWELWKTVFDFAEAGSYRFSSIGNQGAEETSVNATRINPRPVGNKLHPVTMVSWNDCIVWCNAYSEMEGLDPVYRDIRGNILKDAREPVDSLVDGSKIAGKNGYRLPNVGEWEYVLRGADPDDPIWNSVLNQNANWFGRQTTGEVGSMVVSDRAGTYDMGGLINQWGWDQSSDGLNNSSIVSFRVLFVLSFNSFSSSSLSTSGFMRPGNPSLNTIYFPNDATPQYTGFRVIRDLEPGVTP
jgi:formylglycine-generating enzyme required for sulfatase activity